MGVSAKVYVNFKDFSQDNLHIVKDFIDYVKLLGYTYHYANHELTYQYAFAIDDNGNEITSV